MAGRYVILWAPTLLIHGGIEACQRYLVSQSACSYPAHVASYNEAFSNK